MKSKTKTKPIVKYRTSTGTLAGERFKNRYRLTLLATIRGPDAKALANHNHDRATHWYYDAKKNIMQIFEEKLLGI